MLSTNITCYSISTTFRSSIFKMFKVGNQARCKIIAHLKVRSNPSAANQYQQVECLEKKMEKRNKNKIKKIPRKTSPFFNLNPKEQPITDLFQKGELSNIDESIIYPTNTQNKTWTQFGIFIGTIFFEGSLMIA